jgi:WD40 repeat protein
MALAPDASALAAFDAVLGELSVWELPSGQLRWAASLPSLGQYSPSNDRLAFSPDGEKVVLSHDKANVRVWDAETGRLLHTFPSRKSGPVAFSPDSQRIAYAHWGNVEVYDLKTGKQLSKWEVETWGAPLAWASGARTLLVGDHPFVDGAHVERLSEWDVATGKRLRSWRADKEVKGYSVLSPDGKHLAQLVKDWSHLRVQAVGGAETLRAEVDPAFRPGGFPLFSGDGRQMACVTGDDLKVWDAATGKFLQCVTLRPRNPESFVLSENGGRVAFRSRLDTGLHVWDVRTQRPLLEFVGDIGGPRIVAFSADGREVVTTELDHIQRSDKGHAAWSLVRWDAATGEVKRRVDKDLGQVERAVFSGDGRRVALILPDCTLALWDAARGRELHRWPLPYHEHTIKHSGADSTLRLVALSSFAFSPDGQELLAGAEGKVRRWDTSSGKELPAYDVRGAEIVFLPHSTLQSDAWLPLGTWPNSELRLLDLKTGRLGARFETESRGAQDVALTADGRTLAALEVGRVRLWEVGGWLRGEIHGGYGMVTLSPDCRLLAVAAERDGAILLWDLLAGKVRAVLEGHKGRLASLAFSPDSRRLVSGAHDNVSYIWDVTDSAASERLDDKQLERLWTDLHSPDGAAAYRAIGKLAGDPEHAIPFLQRRVGPTGDWPRIARLISELDADSAKVRDAAGTELARLGRLAAPALEEAEKGKLSAEARRRAHELLMKLPEPPSLHLVGSRVIEALERAGTAEARKVLEELGKQEPWRDEVQTSLRRMRSSRSEP